MAALANVDRNLILQILSSSSLATKKVQQLDALKNFKQNNNNNEVITLKKDGIKQAVNRANQNAYKEHQKARPVDLIKKSHRPLQCRTVVESSSEPFGPTPACALYFNIHTAFNKRDEKQSKLDYEKICASVRVLSVVAK